MFIWFFFYLNVFFSSWHFFHLNVFFQEMKTYCQIGIAIELVRSSLNHLDHLKRNLFTGIAMMIRNINLKFLLFAIGYPSSYRVKKKRPKSHSPIWTLNFRTSFKRKHSHFRFSRVISIGCMDLKQSLEISLLHFWRVDFSIFIQNIRFYRTALRAL